MFPLARMLSLAAARALVALTAVAHPLVPMSSPKPRSCWTSRAYSHHGWQ